MMKSWLLDQSDTLPALSLLCTRTYQVASLEVAGVKLVVLVVAVLAPEKLEFVEYW